MLFKKLSIGFIALFVLFNLSLSQERPELKFRYVKVKKGDTFWRLFGDKWEIVSRLNKIDRWHLGVGTNLKIPLDWEIAKEYPFFPKFLDREKEVPKLILVIIQEQFLAGYEFGELKFWYPVCSGMEEGLTPNWVLKIEAEKEKKARVERPTPRGRFKVIYKDIDHQSSIYPEPDGGQPMPFAVMFSWAGYGFHAWGIPVYLRKWFAKLVEEEAGRSAAEVEAELEKYFLDKMPGWPASHGCLRLFVEDAQKLYEWAETGVVVLIVDSFENLEK